MPLRRSRHSPPLPPLCPVDPCACAPPTPAQKKGYDYKITLGKLTAVARVSRGSDKDYVTLVALGPDGEIGPFNSGVRELSQTGLSQDLNLRSDALRVTSGQSTSLRMSWTAANRVSTDSGKLLVGLGNSAADLLRGIPGNPYTLIGGSLAKLGLTFLQGCDAPLFGGAVLLYTDRLVEGQPLDDWVPEGPNRWHRTFDYPNIASPCATGHYQLEVHIERQPVGS